MRRREFLKITSAFSLLIPSGKIANGALFIDNKHEENIKEHAIAAFKRFEEVWNFNDF